LILREAYFTRSDFQGNADGVFIFLPGFKAIFVIRGNNYILTSQFKALRILELGFFYDDVPVVIKRSSGDGKVFF